jgi:hypothetical protein
VNKEQEEMKISPKFFEDQLVPREEEDTVVFSWKEKLDGLVLPKQTLKAAKKRLETSQM